MPKQIQKSFQDYISKIKVTNKPIDSQLRGCMQSRTLPCDSDGRGNGDGAVALSDVDQFLFENFRSLFKEEYGEETWKDSETESFLFDSPKSTDSPPPENLCGSARFFVNSGSSSSLIMDEASSSCATISESPAQIEEAAAEDSKSLDDFISIFTYSPSPYEDFRRSMQEMVEARWQSKGKVDWEFMEELLFSYLELNNKKSYKHILRAFVDMIVLLRQNAGKVPSNHPPMKGGGAMIKREA